MSCVHFLTGAQRARLRPAVPAGPLSSWRSPERTESKLRRLRLLALDPDPRIRESAALAAQSPPDVLTALSRDGESGVRVCVARNRGCPTEVLNRLPDDADPMVRGWVAANPSTPGDTLARLDADPEPVVRRVAAWARSWPAP